MKEGYIILPRAVLDDDYFSQKFTRAQAYIDLYFLAAYKERSFLIRGNRVTVKRGQVAVSMRDLAARWHWSKNTVAKFLSELQYKQKIGTQKSRVINIITLNLGDGIDPQNDPQNDPPINKGKLKNKSLKEKYKKENGKNRKHHPTAADNAAEFIDKLAAGR